MKLKRVVCTLLVLVSTAFSFCVSAAPIIENESVLPASVDENEASPRAEQTQWVYRVYEGRLQKRLWSNTQGIWLTDWIDC